ncbi:glycosyltransferase family 2 protein [uncultured Parabacteroides sp.]|jgi:GT2 family glycosyltransferase|uniref:glycosyltransferase family 2 protein n=1 Tax=uncultured Parabacteroides sp. TaxID=512312 RepID=UPI0025CC9A69|nr:glycosyltransferase family 2 protein [uncultured Parabacteroides sp.]
MISIITVNYNGIVDTRNLLNSLCINIVDIEYEMVVVDNGSKENEAELLQQEFFQIKAIRSDVNLGFSGGNNLGVKYSKGDYLLFLNNDLIITSDFITPLLDIFSQKEKVGIVSPQILNMDGSLCYGGCEPIGRFLLRIHYLNGDPKNGLQTLQEVSLAHGAALMIKRDILNSVGGWPDIYFLYSEEVDLSICIKNLGYSIWYEPNSFVYHLGSQSTGKGSPLVCYYNTRNRLLLYKRNLKGVVQTMSILYQVLLNVYHLFLLLISRKTVLAKAVFCGTKDFFQGKFFKKV